MVLALLLSLLGPAPASAAAVASDDPPIKVWLNQDSYFRRGDRARVHVKVADDGYLVVLRADADGRVRVLFPLDPSDDAFVRGGEKLEIRGRGDREAFYIDEREGSGVVLAARSAAPFRFEEFVRGDHWDYGVLDARNAGGDKEAALLDIVQRMTPDGHFDYDAQKYFVESPRAYYYDRFYPSFVASFGYGWGWPSYGYGVGFGFGYGSYNSCFDPFFYDPFFCSVGFYSPFYYDPFFYRPFFYRPFFYSPFVYVTRPYIFGYQPYAYYPRRGGGSLYGGFPGYPRTGGIGPRLRIPQGALLGRTARVGGVPVRVRDAGVHDAQRGPFVTTTSFPVRERDDRPGRRAPAREPERSVTPERRAAPAAAPAERGRDRGSWGGRGGGGGGGGGGGRSARGGGGGGGRRRP